MTTPLTDPPGHSLVMPFVVCGDDGYDDEAFVIGWECGVIDQALAFLTPIGGELCRYVHSGAVPQLDLIAMRHGYTLAHEPWEDDREWTFAKFTLSREEANDG